MNYAQITTAALGVLATVISIWAVWLVATTPTLRRKPLWIIGSLFGFCGFAVDWTSPDDLVLELGAQVPVVMLWALPDGHIALQTMFPFIAIVALRITYKLRRE